MKIGIVGANGHVGAELTVILDAWDGVTPVPIVRNQLASHFLEAYGVPVRIADVTDDEQAEEALSDLDMVVIAARVSQNLAFRTPKEALQLNKDIIECVVDRIPRETIVVFLSSIAAFGDDLYGPVETPWLYAKEKRSLEEHLADLAEDKNARWFALRIGNVFGPFQVREQRIKLAFRDSGDIVVPADGDRESNALHTVTLAGVLVRCLDEALGPGTYTVVNSPRWTWADLLGHYNDSDRKIEFKGASAQRDRTLPRSFTELTKAAMKGSGRHVSLVYRSPNALQHWIHQRYLKSAARSSVEKANPNSLDLPMFRFDPVPGPHLEPSMNTEALLETYSGPLESAFSSALPLSGVHSLPPKTEP